MRDFNQLLRLKDVAIKLGVSSSTVWRLVRDGKLPKPIKMGARISVWSALAIDQYIRFILSADVNNQTLQ